MNSVSNQLPRGRPSILHPLAILERVRVSQHKTTPSPQHTTHWPLSARAATAADQPSPRIILYPPPAKTRQGCDLVIQTLAMRNTCHTLMMNPRSSNQRNVRENYFSARPISTALRPHVQLEQTIKSQNILADWAPRRPQNLCRYTPFHRYPS
jgi:hypothetical protein